MKKRNNVYYILTYLFFIYPPFIWGLVEIYRESNWNTVHITSLYINLILIAVIGITCFILIRLNKIHTPSEIEIKYLIFGLVGNTVVYFYTFQNLMNIDDFITTYLVLLVVLSVHYLLISRKLVAKELWLLLPIFLLVDILHLIITGCGYTDGSYCYDQAGISTVVLYILYITFLLPSIAYYIYRVYLLKMFDVLKVVNIVLIIVMSVNLQIVDYISDEYMMTIMIMLPFFTLVDFIISIVNKRYSHKMLFFYVRTYSILMVFAILGGTEFFYGETSSQILPLMVFLTYISLFVNIFRSLLKVDQIKTVSIDRSIIISKCLPEHIDIIKEHYGEKEAEHMSLEDNSFSLVAIQGEKVVGFISTYIKNLAPPLDTETEAYINIIEVHTEHQRKGIATRLLEKTEKHFKSLGIKQIRGWSSEERTEAIHLWNKLNYSLSPAFIHIKVANINVHGYYFVKKL